MTAHSMVDAWRIVSATVMLETLDQTALLSRLVLLTTLSMMVRPEVGRYALTIVVTQELAILIKPVLAKEVLQVQIALRQIS